MQLIDRLEKGGRLLLWVVISAVLVIGFAVVPLKLVEQQEGERELRAALEEMTDKLEELQKVEPETKRIGLKTVGPVLSALYFDEAMGRVWFTNVSPVEGVTCAQGVATNDSTGESTVSLPACVAVPAYSSPKLEMVFAFGDLKSTCGGASGCSFTAKDVADSAPPVAVAKAP